jgi:hypothetical protein
MTTPRTASLRQLARLIGVDDKSVRKAEAAGVFKDAVRRGDDGAPVVVDLAAAIAAWERSGRQLRGTRRPEATASTSPMVATALPTQGTSDGDTQSELTALLARVRELRGLGTAALPDDAGDGRAPVDDSPSLVDAQIESHLERARKLRMENDLREGALVEAAVAAKAAFEFARTVRENVLNVPARLAAELAADMDASRVARRLEGALREALETTANAMDAPAVPPPAAQ